jgi:hypothetical protein
MPPQERDNATPRFFMSDFFVSHTLSDTDYCRLLVLPAIEAVVERNFNQYVFMNLENFGKSSVTDGKNAAFFAKAYSKEVERLLRDSRFMLVVASLAATQSAWVRYEVGWWVSNRSVKEMMILLREPCEPERLHSGVGQCRWLTLIDLPEADAVGKLRAVLESMLSPGQLKGDHP